MKKYYIDEFVNYDAPARGHCVDMSAQINTSDSEVLYEQLPFEFSERFEWDDCNQQAWPVMIWENQGEPVAFWDCDYCVGYVVS